MSLMLMLRGDTPLCMY